MTNRKKKIKNYVKLLALTHKSFEKLNSLKSKAFYIGEALFVERLQPTKGYFRPKVMDFIIPNDWKNEDPCAVTIYRNAFPDWLDDSIHNVGTDADVKTFTCPHFDENVPCTMECKYRYKNNEFLKLYNNTIPDAQRVHDALVAKRKNTWKQIFSIKTK